MQIKFRTVLSAGSQPKQHARRNFHVPYTSFSPGSKVIALGINKIQFRLID